MQDRLLKVTVYDKDAIIMVSCETRHRKIHAFLCHMIEYDIYDKSLAHENTLDLAAPFGFEEELARLRNHRETHRFFS